MATEQKTYQQVYEEYWKDLVETDGQLDKDKVMRELSDYKFMLEQVPLVYMHVSGGRISKPNTYAFEVNQQADEWCDRFIEEALEDEAASHDIPGEDA